MKISFHYMRNTQRVFIVSFYATNINLIVCDINILSNPIERISPSYSEIIEHRAKKRENLLLEGERKRGKKRACDCARYSTRVGSRATMPALMASFFHLSSLTPYPNWQYTLRSDRFPNPWYHEHARFHLYW